MWVLWLIAMLVVFTLAWQVIAMWVEDWETRKRKKK